MKEDGNRNGKVIVVVNKVVTFYVEGLLVGKVVVNIGI